MGMSQKTTDLSKFWKSGPKENKGKTNKSEKSEEKKFRHLTDHFASLANFWKAGTKVISKNETHKDSEKEEGEEEAEEQTGCW